MSVARIAISLEPALARAVRRSAGKQATSAWIADAARRKLRSEGLLAVVADWESTNGSVTPAEMRKAARRRKVRPRS